MSAEHERRLAEYERQVGELQGQVKGARGRGRRPPPPAPGRPQAGPHPRGADPRDQGPARPGRLPERTALRHPARGARAHRRAPRRGREAHDAAVGLRHLPRRQRRRHRRRLHRRAQDARRRCTPRSTSTSSTAARRSCSTSRSTSCSPAALEVAGEVVVLKELLEDGTRALIVGRADEERVVRARRRAARREAARRRPPAHGRPLRPARRAPPAPRGRGARARRGPRHHLRRRRRPRRPDRRRSRTRSSCRTCTPSCSTSTSCSRRRASCCTGRPGCGKTLIAKAVANSLAKRVAEKTGNDDDPLVLPQHQGPGAPQQVRRRDRAPDPPHLPAGAREVARRACPVIVFFDEMDSLFRTRGTGISLRHREHDRAAAARRDRRRREPEERDRDRRLEPRGPHRPRDPAAGPPRREDQDRAPRRGARRRRSSRRYLTPTCRSPRTRPTQARRRRAQAVDGDDRRRGRRACTPIDDDNRFLEVTYQNGDKEILFFKDFSSGAMIENIVRRAKKLSIKRQIDGGAKGICTQDLARLDHAGVPRARGPAEHDEPRRLGEDLGQEGRAHRVRAHAAHRGRRAPPAAVRSSASPPASTCSGHPASRRRGRGPVRTPRSRWHEPRVRRGGGATPPSRGACTARTRPRCRR